MLKTGFFRSSLTISILCLIALLHHNSTYKTTEKDQTVYQSESTTEAYLNVEEEKECFPQKIFVYVKTHKTGSTTVWKRMSAFATKHKIQVVHKMFKPFMSGYPGKLEPRFTFKVVNNQTSLITTYPDVPVAFLDHFRYNSNMREHMSPDVKYISVIREPWSHFQSSFYYYYHNILFEGRQLNCANYPYFHIAKGRPIALLEYLRLAAKNLNQTIPWYFRSKNGQAYDLGIDAMLSDDAIIKREVERITAEMDLVLITEYMDQSMILLKDMFCMEWEDIIFQDDGKIHKYMSANLPTDLGDQQTFATLNKIDIALYKKLNETLWKKIDAYGVQKMERDVDILRNLRNRQHRKIKKRKKQKRSLKARKEELYEISLKNFNKKTMKAMLVKRISEEARMDLPKTLVDELADYMLENAGGCPL